MHLEKEVHSRVSLHTQAHACLSPLQMGRGPDAFGMEVTGAGRKDILNTPVQQLLPRSSQTELKAEGLDGILASNV